jgi:hypothetical protein
VGSLLEGEGVWEGEGDAEVGCLAAVEGWFPMVKTYLWCKLNGKGIGLLDHAVSFDPFSRHGGECQVGGGPGQNIE